MRWHEDASHEPCPHCGRNACSWHLPGRICRYAYADQPGQVDIRYIDVLGIDGVQAIEVLKRPDGRHEMFIE